MQACNFSGEITAVGMTLGGTLRVRSRQASKFNASAGHASTHLGFPLQRKHLVAVFVSGSKDIISHGQARWHILHPMQLSMSTTRAFSGGLTTIASFGQAFAQATGWGHCLH